MIKLSVPPAELKGRNTYTISSTRDGVLRCGAMFP